MNSEQVFLPESQTERTLNNLTESCEGMIQVLERERPHQFGNLDEEYQIDRPNDLEALLRTKNRLQRDLEIRVEKEKMILQGKKSNQQSMASMTAEEAVRERLKMSKDMNNSELLLGKSKAMQMMQNMGYKQGKGLGREE